ncbi:MAG: zinc-binding dehydrogenase [Alphaproteobacteria bacterium]|nr:zinc-binding dehydrogenase [Alphaproteobacteria bacterium]
MSAMRAARLDAPGKPLRIEAVAIPKPGPDEVLVRVEACGLCGTDLHLAVVGDIPVERAPITLGHEGAGTVVALGRDVTDRKEGDRVVLFPAAFCGRCRFCLKGRESLCDHAKVYGMGRDGALAEFITVPARATVPLPAGIPFAIGAIVADGVSTPFHALRSRGRLQAGETVAVVGCGGLGTHAILLARLMGAARIAAVDVDAGALARAKDAGAELAIDSAKEDPAKAIRARFGRGVDLALEFVGLPQTVETAIKLLDKTGRAVVVGVGMGRPALPPLAAFVGREQAVIGSFGMDRADIEDLLGLIAAGRLDLAASVSGRYPLAEINTALARLASKEGGVARVVIEPGLG